ncbi:regulatory protein GemA [Caviibacterium pharyngocola]|uniref:Regulatory protein GemA n=2 Tax=Caviibacterium pharyngocola TaxID=28159 RepID=A0A2M8RY30_9PAST|nr:regulatory protein GemA [Caviibacterium pharyngocola]
MTGQAKALMAKIHIGKTQLKMDDVTYRVFLRNLVGKASCKEMTEQELKIVLSGLKQKGFTPVATRFKVQKRPTPPADKAIYLAKITALLANQGKPQSYADAVAKKAFGVDFVHWLAVWQLKKVIQMLAVYEHRQNK